MGRRTKSTAVPAGRLPAPDETVGIEGVPGGPYVAIATSRRDGLLQLEPPRVGGRPVRLKGGRAVEVHYRSAEVPCIARGRLTSPPDGEPGMWIEVIGVERLQRREAVRVPVNVPVTAVIEVEDDEEPVVMAVFAEDVSALGMRLRSDVRLERDTAMELHFSLNDADFRLAARVVRSTQSDMPVERPWTTGACFEHPDAQTIEQLTAFVFQRQRELRRRAAGVD